MSSASKEIVSSNENRKKSGGKYKRGKPVGPREVVEKYKAIGLESLDCHSHKQLKIQTRVAGYRFNKCANRIGLLLSNETRQGKKLSLKNEILVDEDELSLEDVEYEAREKALQLAQEEVETARLRAEVTEKDAKLADVEASKYADALAWARRCVFENAKDKDRTLPGESSGLLSESYTGFVVELKTLPTSNIRSTLKPHWTYETHSTFERREFIDDFVEPTEEDHRGRPLSKGPGH